MTSKNAEDSIGVMRSPTWRWSWNLLSLQLRAAEGAYETPPALRQFLQSHGFEVGVHDLHHDGKLYRSRKSFRIDARKINRYLSAWTPMAFNRRSCSITFDGSRT